jgi:hypothetical protein
LLNHGQHDEALELLTTGANALASRQQYAAAYDLGTSLIQYYEKLELSVTNVFAGKDAQRRCEHRPGWCVLLVPFAIAIAVH